MRHAVAALAFIAAAACATGPTPYEPARSATSYGFSEQPIETGRYRVTYRAKTPAEARTLALRRAADLTLLEGRDWFQVVDGYTQGFAPRNPGSSVSIGGGTGGANSSFGLGVGFPLGGGGGTGDAESGIEILMGSGEKPDDPDAYDARSVIENAVSVPVN